MTTEVVMPKLGLNMSEGLLVEWLKKEGDPVKRGEPLFIVETDKVTTESTAQVDGRLAKILVEAGQTVPVRTVVALLAAEGEQVSAPVVAQPDLPKTEAPEKAAAPGTEAASRVRTRTRGCFSTGQKVGPGTPDRPDLGSGQRS